MIPSLNSFVHDCVDARIVSVISVRPTRRSPAFAYTIGRHGNEDAPELLLVGVPFPEAGHILSEAASSLLSVDDKSREPWRLKGSGVYVRAQAIPTEKVERLMLWAVRYYGHSRFPALEVLTAGRVRKAA